VVIGTHARGFEGNVDIWWTNPIWDPIFDYSVAVRSFTGFPQDINDGDIIYQGTEQQVTDIGLDESRVSVTLGTAGIDEESILPESISSLKCYPNPFNASVTISFVLSQAGSVSLSIYNIRGQRVAIPLQNFLSVGEHTITWNGSDFPSGVYFARLQAGVSSKSIKMVLLK